MHIFHRSSSSSSRTSTSTTSSTSFASASATPRSSIDHDSSLEETLKPQTAPILGLPIELIQHISSYLDTSSRAPLSLSSRYIYYALGSTHLTQHIDSSNSRFQKRRRIEELVERAFPGHWFCAWCDRFHAWTPSTGPTSADAKSRECAEFNSYLDAGEGSNYVLRFHHIRLAMHHALHGPSHGIPLQSFTHTHASTPKIYRTPIPSKLDIDAHIVNARFILRAQVALILPSWCTSRKALLTHIWPLLPHIAAGHRDSENGHTGLMAALDNVLRRGWTYPFTQTCASCRTDWSVSAHEFKHSTGGQVRLVVRTWRDLGDGRNPFDSGWRAHGVCVRGLEGRRRGDGGRVAGWQAGDVRRAFESGDDGGGGGGVERAESPVRGRIYQAFMRKEGDGDVRRSNVRRTRSENDREMGWEVEEDRWRDEETWQ